MKTFADPNGRHWQAIAHHLARGERLVLARIVRQSGSAPRSLGTDCLFLSDGTIVGTIGGGRLEYEVFAAAREVLNQGCSARLAFTLSGADVAGSEMICGGTLEVHLEPLFGQNAGVTDLFGRIDRLLTEGRSAVLVTRTDAGTSHDAPDNRLLVEGPQQILGALPAGSRPAAAEPTRLLAAPGPRSVADDNGVSFFVEPVCPADVLFIFGAGHISTFLATTAAMVGFQVVVIDDRTEFANRERFPTARQLLVLAPAEAFARIALTPSSYIAIVTRGHIHDHEVLGLALGHDCAYVGMIGSRRKRDLIYADLRRTGVPDDKLQRVHSPIGIDIGGQTPEEIAVSIVAELIQVRAGRSGGFPLLKT